MMKRRGLLCLLALLLLAGGAAFAGSYCVSASTIEAPYSPHFAQTFLATRGPKFPIVAENTLVVSEAVLEAQSQPDLLPNDLFVHPLLVTGNSARVLFIGPSARTSANALLLPVIARLLGLSSLVLRE